MRRVISALVVAVFVITALGVAVTPSHAPAQASGAESAAVPGTVIVDELSDGFRPKGFGWRSASFGYAGHHYWARTSRTFHLAGIWRATLDPGLYRVLAKVPSQHASTRKAVYKVKTADGWRKRVRSQRFHRGRWLSLGTHAFATTAEVRLIDKTLDPKGTRRKVAFDAVKFVPVVPPGPGPTPSPSPSPKPTPSPTPKPTPSPTATPIPAPPVINDIVVKPEEFRAVVTFGLDAKGPARTEYRRAETGEWLLGAEETSYKFANHREVITGLSPETEYELRIIATNAGGKTVSDIVTFETK